MLTAFLTIALYTSSEVHAQGIGVNKIEGANMYYHSCKYCRFNEIV